MFSFIWHTIFFDPIYNCLVFFIDAVPGGDVGLAIIFTTALVKFLLLPLSLKSVRAQLVIRQLEPKLTEIKEKFKNNREEQAKATMAAYREAGVNPFSSILLLFVQIPIVIALYLSISRGGGVPLPDINIPVLYPFIPVPEVISTMFLGLIDIAAKSAPLALLAAVTQFISTSLTMPKPKKRAKDAGPNFKEDLAHSMHFQMRYMMPVIIFFVAYTFSAAIAVYFTVSNLATIAQEYVVRSKGLKPRE